MSKTWRVLYQDHLSVTWHLSPTLGMSWWDRTYLGIPSINKDETWSKVLVYWVIKPEGIMASLSLTLVFIAPTSIRCLPCWEPRHSLTSNTWLCLLWNDLGRWVFENLFIVRNKGDWFIKVVSAAVIPASSNTSLAASCQRALNETELYR